MEDCRWKRLRESKTRVGRQGTARWETLLKQLENNVLICQKLQLYCIEKIFFRFEITERGNTG